MVDFIAAYNEGIAKVIKEQSEEIKQVFEELNTQTLKATDGSASMYLKDDSVYIDSCYTEDLPRHVCNIKFTRGGYPIKQGAGQGIIPQRFYFPIENKEQLEGYLCKLLEDPQVGQIFKDMAS
jgi:hypothetical protein